ncbi:MAG: hypothetical protein JJ956_09870 [Pseudomonadales bacterium]|nr:hypothetical protein [Pseudomonadales bacterium]
MSATIRSGYFTPLLFLLVAAATAILGSFFFMLQNFSADTTLLFTRYTARVSFMFFLPVFALGALHQHYPTDLGRALMGRRRQLGLAFAAAHTVHLVGIIANYLAIDAWFSADDTAAIVIYVFIGLMAVTSNSFSVRQLKGVWRVLHKVGLYGIFIGFFVTYLGRVQGYSQSQLDPSLMDPFWVYVVLLALVTSAWLLRIAAFWQKRG